jgi:RNA-directed DNA polymerase
MNTAPTLMYEWKDLSWKAIERQVFKLQKRIYQATVRQDKVTVHKLQRLLLKSWAARCLAVRRVTQDNRGKRTAGIDGKTVLNPKERMELVEALKANRPPQALRRVWIEKTNSPEKRPLGIPTIFDRAHQALVKLALEPEWEAQFEANSYGFRPGRGAHDAIEAIFTSLRESPKYILDADIAKCFDHIQHEALLSKLETYPQLRRQIRAWLKAGVMDGQRLFPTEAGTPQGGVISPLLANIALHGLETELAQAISHRIPVRCIRYADDFVVLHPELTVIETAQRFITDWLKSLDLELKASKTRITHSLEPYQGTVGFDFLGFTVRQFKVGRSHQSRNSHGTRRPFKTIVKPSREAVQKHYRRIADIISRYNNAPQIGLIRTLNPIMRGWSNYYATVVSKVAFSRLDHLVTQRLLRWARRRHPKQSRFRIARRYWQFEKPSRHWIFRVPDQAHLYQYADTPIKRHIKVQGTRNPFDGDWLYWGTRLGRHPELPTLVATLLKAQSGRCAACGLHFRHTDILEIDHIIPKQYGGSRHYSNLQLLHGHCHQLKSRHDNGIYDQDYFIEEPCEVKVSSTVLKTSSEGDLWT